MLLLIFSRNVSFSFIKMKISFNIKWYKILFFISVIESLDFIPTEVMVERNGNFFLLHL